MLKNNKLNFIFAAVSSEMARYLPACRKGSAGPEAMQGLLKEYQV